MRDGRVIKETLHNGAPSAMQAWYFNLRRPVFKDPRVREAITLCFDFEWTNKNVMYSLLQAGHVAFPEHRDGGARASRGRRS